MRLTKTIIGTLIGLMSLGLSWPTKAQVVETVPTLTIPEKIPLSSVDRWREVELIHTLRGHRSIVDSIAFTPDNKALISGEGYNNGRIHIWWLETGREIGDTRAQRNGVVAMAVSPDGKIIASTGEDAGINLWTWQTGKYDRLFLDHSHNILALTITPDSQVLISGGLDGIRLWDLRSKRPIYTLARFDTLTYQLAIHPNGYILASGSGNGEVKIWNLRTAKLIGQLSGHRGKITAIAFSPDGKLLITGGEDRKINLWNLETRKLQQTLTGATGKINSIAIHPEGEIFASGSRDGIHLWSIQGELINHFEAHNDWVESLAFSHDGTMLASGGYDNLVKIWCGLYPHH